MAEYIVDTTDGILHSRTTGELVRCGDCKHYNYEREVGYGWCDYHPKFYFRKTDYCSYGERREAVRHAKDD